MRNTEEGCHCFQLVEMNGDEKFSHKWYHHHRRHFRGHNNRNCRHNHYLCKVQGHLVYYDSFLTGFSLSISFKIFPTLFFFMVSFPLSLMLNKVYNNYLYRCNYV